MLVAPHLSNFDSLEDILGAINVPFKLVILTNNTELAFNHSKRKKYDLDFIVNGKRKVSYVALEDKRWKTFSIAWAEFRPYAYAGHGHVAGIDYNVWTTVAKSLGIKLHLKTKSENFVQMYMDLRAEKADAALLGTAYFHSMLQVNIKEAFADILYLLIQVLYICTIYR